MEPSDSPQLTQVLSQVASGQPGALQQLVSIVYNELRTLAAAQLRHERGNHTLQPTALVNEAFLRLAGDAQQHWQNRAHFFGAAAEAMRRILVDHARAREAQKRGGGRDRVPLVDGVDWSGDQSQNVLVLDEALDRLAAADERKAQIVKLRFYAGMSAEETAAALDLSVRTVVREWQFARAWLHRAIARADITGN